MKHLLLILLVSVLLLFSVMDGVTATLSDLIARFDARIQETDSTTALLSTTEKQYFLNMAQDKIITSTTGLLKKSHDITAVWQQRSHRLPADFRSISETIGVIYFFGDQWYQAIPLEFRDTTVINYSVGWDGPDSAQIYIRGAKSTIDGMDTLRVHYEGVANSMDSLTAICEVPSNLQVYVIEEAISMYEQAKRDFQAMQLVMNYVRGDLGVVVQKEQ